MRRVEYHPFALDELIQGAEYYEAQVEGLGERFLDEIEAAIADVSETPEKWPRFLLNTKRRLLNRFPYSVVYLVDSKGIFILAIMHQRRRPEYLKKRLS